METKKCTTCKKDLPKTLDHFASRSDRGKFEWQSSCKKCHKEYRKNHYQVNRVKYINKSKDYKEKNKKWFIELKSKLKCEICGEGRYWLLDFHHKDPNTKEFTISSFVNSQGNKKDLIKELKKCIPLCANCHRNLHYQEKQASNA